MHWVESLQLVLREEACVVVTMKLILGSAPRESGVRMIVTESRNMGSIGGGNLEYTAIRQAREFLLESDLPAQKNQPFGLGPALNQCCGGAVTLHFERFSGECPEWVNAYLKQLEQGKPFVHIMTANTELPHHYLFGTSDQSESLPRPVIDAAKELIREDQNVDGARHNHSDIREIEFDDSKWWLQAAMSKRHPVMLFGAGYVGKEVAKLLQGLPFELTWLDNRPDTLPDSRSKHVKTVFTEEPANAVRTATPGSIYIVMTHSHSLDEDICFEIFQRNDFCWLGLIGSDTKKRRFIQRLNKRGIEPKMLNQLVCPIGLDGIVGKQPATIALSLAAQLMMEKPWINANN